MHIHGSRFIFEDIDSFINEELKKPICKKFKTSGTCAFGENCCNTHYSAEQLSRLKQKGKYWKIVSLIY